MSKNTNVGIQLVPESRKKSMPEPKPDQGPEKTWKNLVFPEGFTTVFRPILEQTTSKRVSKN